MVYYRKYRPQQIDDLDNAHVRETLTSVLKHGNTHAFLFTGPKGLGKTSAARIVAKAVNCTSRAKNEVEPCNTCEQCVSITEGTNLDVLEIDAASNRGIDEIRDLKEKIRLAPVSAQKKVYIIDEVHMLTTEAFNALLKTLEEPPSHAMFILCTTEVHKVPATISSRCFHLHFKPATEEELVRSFMRIVEGEKISSDGEALTYIARMSDCGFRDGAKILEEVVALAEGKKITMALVEEKYQISHEVEFVFQMLTVFEKKETKEGLKIVSKLIEHGFDIKHFIMQLMGNLHELLLVKMGVADFKVRNAGLNIGEVQLLFELLSKAYQETRVAVVPQLPLELAIIEFCETQNVTANPSTSSGMTKDDEGVTVSSLRKKVGEIKKNETLYGEKKKEKEEKEIVETKTVELEHAAPNGDVTPEWLAHFWLELISEMKKHNHTIAGLLRGCKIGSFDKKRLIIQTKYKFHKERLDELKTREALIQAAKLLTGKEIEVVVELRK
ncbi:MAG TPA: DNA polymerase III subunit gamma/tau [Patescibacteria group bacterium]|nr:DNA polymerase III subunit gamma/tau [Patescibacteria group bacterium]